MLRIYHPEAKEGEQIKLNSEQQRHIKVLKIKQGETIKIFDGRGNEFEVVYSGKVRDPLIIGKKTNELIVPNAEITLAIAPAKGNRMDFLVEKAAELGVMKIIPTICERSVVKPKAGKIERWRKITVEACAQSGRSLLPEIDAPHSFDEVLEKVRDYDLAMICDPSGKPMEKDPKGKIIVLIGPEGGFSNLELQKAKMDKIKLSNTILRIETAGIAAVAQIVGRNI